MPRVWVYGALALVGIIYGANYGIAKTVMPDYLQPFGFILVRVTAATLIFWLIHAFTAREKVNLRQDGGRLALCGLLGVASNQLLFFKGLSLTSPINASLIMTITPVLVLIASAILIKEKITWQKTAGILLGLSGAALLIFLRSRGNIGGQSSLSGDVLVFLNATSYGLYLVNVKPLMQRYRSLTVVKWVFLIGWIIIIPFGWQEAASADYPSFPWEAWAAIGFVILFTTCVAYLLNAWALNYVSSSVVGIFIYLQPLFATLIAIILKQDEPNWFTGFCALLIFSGVYLVSKKNVKVIRA
jgi:drug/metabolite transporter (DMT)-like permease